MLATAKAMKRSTVLLKPLLVDSDDSAGLKAVCGTVPGGFQADGRQHEYVARRFPIDRDRSLDEINRFVGGVTDSLHA
jgi:hypothetical protein